ncbi:MAG: hypothetical protein HQL93_08770 [Magnetococcales bacterium]|nr:hypothetical protein [Magnetococcales bacterium]
MATGKVHQLQAAYSPVEDRLLLRINTSGKQEFRFWLTRHFVRRLWPVLRQTLESHSQVSATDINARAAVLEFIHQNATDQANFKAPFKEVRETVMPLGPEPTLAVQASIAPVAGNENLRMVSLHPEHGYGIEVAMDMPLMHAFCKLLLDAIATTEWDLELGFSTHFSMQTMTQTGGRLLH